MSTSPYFVSLFSFLLLTSLIFLNFSYILCYLQDHITAASRPDTHLYNSLMKAHITASDPADDLAMLRQMKADGVDPNLITYNTLIYGFARAEMVTKARTYLDVMVTHGLFLDVMAMCVKGDAIGVLDLL
jgi:pentatricopeptide repeat protein